MALEKVPDHKYFWKWWSVQLSVLSGSLSAAALAYGGIMLTAPALVADIPKWVGVVTTGGAMFSAFAGAWVRQFIQPKLWSDSDAREISEDQKKPDEAG